MKIVHFLYPDKDGCIYCKKINGLVKILPLKTPCLRCEKFRGTIQGLGCECCWDDFDFDRDISVLDQEAEYDRVNSFKSLPKAQRLDAWQQANDRAARERTQTRQDIWVHLREFAALVAADESDALSAMDQDLSFAGIAGEDSYDFIQAQMKYRQWLDNFIKEWEINV